MFVYMVTVVAGALNPVLPSKMGRTGVDSVVCPMGVGAVTLLLSNSA